MVEGRLALVKILPRSELESLRVDEFNQFSGRIKREVSFLLDGTTDIAVRFESEIQERTIEKMKIDRKFRFRWDG